MRNNSIYTLGILVVFVFLAVIAIPKNVDASFTVRWSNGQYIGTNYVDPALPYNGANNDYTSPTYNSNNYNNNYYNNLNPAPIIYSVNPNSVNIKNENVTINLTGIKFIPSSVVKWNDSDRSTIYVDSKHLTVVLNASDFSKSGDNIITVFNPAPGGGTSNEVFFTVKDPNGTNLSANALFAGFMPSNLFQWLLLFILILLIVILTRKMIAKKNKKTALTISNLSSTSVSVNATGLTSNGVYMFEITGTSGTTKLQAVTDNDGAADASFSNLVPNNRYTVNVRKYDPSTGLVSNVDIPILHFDTLKHV